MYRASNQQRGNAPYLNAYTPPYTQSMFSENRQYHPYINQGQWNGAGMNGQNFYNMPMQPNYLNNQPSYYHPQNAYKSSSQEIFQNPLHYMENPEMNSYSQNYMNPNQGFMNPYPKQSFIPKKQGNVKSIMNSFKSQDGSLDFNKMMDTAGLMMNAMNQVTGLVKGVGGIFKV
ncbi:YppG family protein [Niallia sp.]|uniref:YppG family protein n=1 Tax=Niallia sp. TaxID=2837523 RepID=UPI00289EF75F|nr:YppG family protein [Niallia sp.]